MQLMVAAEVMHTRNWKTFIMKALIDSGCAWSCINTTLMAKQGWPMNKLLNPIEIVYADGGKNPNALAREYCKIIVKVHGLEMLICPLVTKLGQLILYLGYDWLVGVNPMIDWWTSWIATTIINKVPDYIKEFMDIFSEAEFQKLLPLRKWDHKIKLTSDAMPKGRVYLMSRKELEVLDAFWKRDSGWESSGRAIHHMCHHSFSGWNLEQMNTRLSGPEHDNEEGLIPTTANGEDYWDGSVSALLH